MKIGEFFVKNKYIKKDVLDKALELQKSYKDKHICNIFVIMGVISKENLVQYVRDYIDYTMTDPALWLRQEDVDVLFNKEKNSLDNT